jgi:serine protease AprX
VDPTKIQRWQLEAVDTDVELSGNIALKFYAVSKNFQPNVYGKVWAYLIDRNGEQGEVIASAFNERSNWGTAWKRRTISFNDVNYTLLEGHQLEIALLVDGNSAEDMWFGYDTKKQAAHLKVNFLAEWPHYLLDIIGAPAVWAQGYEGESVRVAVVDSGIRGINGDFVTGIRYRVVAKKNLRSEYNTALDKFGHGTYVAGIIGSDGSRSDGKYKGVAPQVRMVNVRVNDEWGSANESDVVAGLQWALEKKDKHNIRVINLSLNGNIAHPYNLSALDAAVEMLWLNGIVVVVASGNNGVDDPGVLYPPANDPYAIVVGSSDDLGTLETNDDTVAEFSAFGTTSDNYFRPDVVAPSTYLVSSLSDSTRFKQEYPDHHVLKGSSRNNFVASGTSAAAAVVSGSVALLLDAVPELTPNQVKWLLINSATPLPGEPGAGAGIVNVENMVNLALSFADPADVPEANSGLIPHQLLAKMALIAYWASQNGGENIDWDSVNWNSVGWNSVNWNSVNWNSVNWNAVNWNAVNWNAVNWNAVNWNAVNWNSVGWNSVNWNSVGWNSVNWNSVDLDY